MKMKEPPQLRPTKRFPSVFDALSYSCCIKAHRIVNSNTSLEEKPYFVVIRWFSKTQGYLPPVTERIFSHALNQKIRAGFSNWPVPLHISVFGSVNEYFHSYVQRQQIRGGFFSRGALWAMLWADINTRPAHSVPDSCCFSVTPRSFVLYRCTKSVSVLKIRKMKTNKQMFSIVGGFFSEKPISAIPEPTEDERHCSFSAFSVFWILGVF